jgi:hypothetical protein
VFPAESHETYTLFVIDAKKSLNSVVLVNKTLKLLLLFIFSETAAQRGIWPSRHVRFLDHTQ